MQKKGTSKDRRKQEKQYHDARYEAERRTGENYSYDQLVNEFMHIIEGGL